MRILYQIPTFLQRLYTNVVWRGDKNKKVIYLTFDDGCIPEVTPRILQILNEKQVKATFFCVGENIERYPTLFQQIIDNGHAIGNHTYHHLRGLKYSTAQYLQDIEQTDKLISQLSTIHGSADRKNCQLFRPPHGRMTFAQKRAVQKTHKIILWDLLTHDYNPQYSPERMLRIIKKYTRNGSIVVFHDSLKSNERMLQVLPQAIDYWHAQGYELLPITPSFAHPKDFA